jgi:hypothetical protein
MRVDRAGKKTRKHIGLRKLSTFFETTDQHCSGISIVNRRNRPVKGRTRVQALRAKPRGG